MPCRPQVLACLSLAGSFLRQTALPGHRVGSRRSCDVVIAKFNLPHIPEAEGGHAVANDSVWRHRNLVMGTAGIFAYVGAEVAIGSFLVNYMNLGDIGNLRPEVAAKYLTFYWGGAMIGRFIGSAVLQKVPTRVVLGFNAIVAAVLVCLSMLSFGHVAMWALLLVGLFNSIMFPSIFTLGHRRPGAADRRSFRPADYGHCGRRHYSRTARTSGRPRRPASRFRPAGDLLLVYFVFRPEGPAQTAASCCVRNNAAFVLATTIGASSNSSDITKKRPSMGQRFGQN